MGEEEVETVGLGHEQAALVGTDCNALSLLSSLLSACLCSFLVIMEKIEAYVKAHG